MNYKYKYLFIAIGLFITTSCENAKIEVTNMRTNKIADLSIEKLEKLSKKRIYFAHKSVGYNIMDGVEDILKNNPNLKLKVVETTNERLSKNGVFAHSPVGKNGDTLSKLKGLEENLANGMGDKIDIVAIKFCWADIMGDADIDVIFNDYKKYISKIKKKYPHIKIIHFTVPLTTTQKGIKAWLKKKLMKKEPWGLKENILRNEYNKLLIEKYENVDPIFDIARIESTYPDGKRSFFMLKGKKYYQMVPEYTPDHGHLNEIGRKIVAEELLVNLANNM